MNSWHLTPVTAIGTMTDGSPRITIQGPDGARPLPGRGYETPMAELRRQWHCGPDGPNRAHLSRKDHQIHIVESIDKDDLATGPSCHTCLPR